MFTIEEKAILECLLDTSSDVSDKMCEGCIFNKNDNCTVDSNIFDRTNWIKYKNSIKMKLVDNNLL